MGSVDPREECIFCRIIRGEIPSEIVLRNRQVVAFRDISPVASTHVLIVPVAHVVDAAHLSGTDGESLAAMFVAAREIAESEGVAESGFRLVYNVGEDAGNTVAHLHMHLIGGRLLSWPPG